MRYRGTPCEDADRQVFVPVERLRGKSDTSGRISGELADHAHAWFWYAYLVAKAMSKTDIIKLDS